MAGATSGWSDRWLTPFHLRRFCRIPIVEEVPDESTVRKLTRRLGPELVDDLIREVIKLAVTERGFRVRANALRLRRPGVRHPLPDRLRACRRCHQGPGPRRPRSSRRDPR